MKRKRRPSINEPDPCLCLMGLNSEEATNLALKYVLKAGDEAEALCAAASLGSDITLKQLMDAGAPAFAVRAPSGETALHFATTPTVVRLLVDRGADPSSTDIPTLETPLHRAAEKGRVKVVEALLLLLGPSGIDPLDKIGQTPLRKAVLSEEIGSDEAAILLVQKGADIYDLDLLGNAVFHDTVSRGSKDLLELVVRKASEFGLVDLANGWGQTPLHLACLRCEKDEVGGLCACKHLLQAGGDVSIADVDGKTPYDLAQDSSSEDLLKSMHLAKVEKNVDERYRGQSGET